MKISNFINIGERIKKLRKAKTSLSQREMANLLEIPYSTYSNYENNNRVPNVDMVKKICTILECDLDDLIVQGEHLAFSEDGISFIKDVKLDSTTMDRIMQSIAIENNITYFLIDDDLQDITKLTKEHIISLMNIYSQKNLKLSKYYLGSKEENLNKKYENDINNKKK